MTASLTTTDSTDATDATPDTMPGITDATIVGNSLAHGHTPTDPAPFTTTRPAVSPAGTRTTRATRRSARAHHPGRDARTAVVDAASSLVSDGGFAAATTRNIAELTGLASGAVERQFSTHDDLLAAVFQRLAAAELAAVDHASRTRRTTARDRLTALVDTFATRALHGRHTAEALLFEPVGARVNQERLTCRRQYHSLIVGVIADGVSTGELPAQDPGTSARAVTGAVVETLLGRLSPAVPCGTGNGDNGGNGDSRGGRSATPLIDEVTALVLRLVGA
ncbi:TetR/AcrR family transcriptional regulator [uncultured Corynebacterium sp.]|uniref:TetR/AcrR family transcriptional regulator n=1 Tax=uncultured Corynebacterium sp. TaxID=159447 RepID=UPI0025EEF8F1|nr:TetR/AcrR family transcriptional regulator [uncultured Corynebacterium sp.]